MTGGLLAHMDVQRVISVATTSVTNVIDETKAGKTDTNVTDETKAEMADTNVIDEKNAEGGDRPRRRKRECLLQLVDACCRSTEIR